MTRNEWSFAYKRMCAYFSAQVNPAQEKEFYDSRFEFWTVAEWDHIWGMLSEMALPRIPGYGDFASLRRQIYVQNQHLRKETRTVCADCNGTGWEFTGPQFGAPVRRCAHLHAKQVDADPPFDREGMKTLQMRMVGLHDATVATFVKDGPKPLAQVLVEGSIKWVEGITRQTVGEETARRDYDQNQQTYGGE